MLIAPASANTLAKLANGICDNLLSAVYLSARCPVYLAPAMDLDMWRHPATLSNIRKLEDHGNILLRPVYGELASGLTGEGRMVEPETIVEFLQTELNKNKPLTGKKALVTAGPTYESIDPVRFIGNHSSGKMGFAIAEQLAYLGASVTLIAGPVSLNTFDKSIKRVNISTANEMLFAVQQDFAQSDITVMSAAVADYQVDNPAESKIKKSEPSLNLHLIKTVDILATIGKEKKDGQVLIGFALETTNEEENAVKKLKSKNLDFIVLNSLQDEGAGFKGDENKITIIDRNLNKEYFELKSKKEVAVDICRRIVDLIQ
jgi:phosphopantothenoylcysteine decarboxylase/phosphopantothenate--cysteine ligase